MKHNYSPASPLKKGPYHSAVSDPSKAFAQLLKRISDMPICLKLSLVQINHLMRKPIKWPVRPVKTQISLGICPVWSESSLCAKWIAEVPMCLHADSQDSDQTWWMPRLIWVFPGHTGQDSQDSDQTWWMPRLIWVFPGHTGQFVGFVVPRLILCDQTAKVQCDKTEHWEAKICKI